MAKAICGWENGMLTLRRDIAYLPPLKGGLGIKSVQDEYWINRARVLGNVMESGERLEGRGQIAWATRLLKEEIEDVDSDGKLIGEIRTMLQKLKLQVVENTEETARQWKEQYQLRQWSTNKTTYQKTPYIGGRFIMSLAQ